MTFEQRYVQARRRFIEADFANLNDMQRKAVLATEGPLLLLAGAGSGKTTVLIHRIANLIQYGRGSDTDEVPDTATEADLALLERTDLTPDERRRAQRAAALEPVEPWRIIAITFTNKAADELKDRIERMLGPEAAADIWASTFHSACVRILRRDADQPCSRRSAAPRIPASRLSSIWRARRRRTTRAASASARCTRPTGSACFPPGRWTLTT